MEPGNHLEASLTDSAQLVEGAQPVAFVEALPGTAGSRLAPELFAETKAAFSMGIQPVHSAGNASADKLAQVAVGPKELAPTAVYAFIVDLHAPEDAAFAPRPMGALPNGRQSSKNESMVGVYISSGSHQDAATRPPSTPVPPAALLASMEAWIDDWQSQKIQPYLAWYDVEFKSLKHRTRIAWERQRRAIFARERGVVRLRIQNISPRWVSSGDLLHQEVSIQFDQFYSADDYQDEGCKTMTWRLVDGQWRIVGETFRLFTKRDKSRMLITKENTSKVPVSYKTSRE